ncbi:MAG TPA: hypothetical protein VFP68_13745, partial [Burkholderiaceae bacterium]|nr:hypothetical protein [Burkholderiaceae bacterium]
MSYVLEALKKADAERERERGSVPGLHAQPLPPPVATLDERPPMRVWPAVAAAVALGLVAALVWHWTRDAPADHVVAATGAGAVAQADQAPAGQKSGTDRPAAAKRSPEPAASTSRLVAGHESESATRARDTR